MLISLCGCATTHSSAHCDSERCNDAAIADKIESALRTAPGIEFWQVRVQYIHDTVYLYGLVVTTPERTDIEHIASTVSGGKKVVNSIEVRGYRY